MATINPPGHSTDPMTSQRNETSRTATIAFIGGGNMARALIAGLREQDASALRIRVYDPDASTLADLEVDFGVDGAATANQAVADADLVMLAVKPQVMAPVCQGLAAALPADSTAVSIAAGIRSAQIDTWLGGGRAVVRAMPNTPALLRAGATGLFANARCSATARALANQVLAAVGVTVWIDDEALMDVVTAVSGSGPAYFFRAIEALQAAAIAQGLDADAARTLVGHTALGAARMALESGEDAQVLRQRVTSPGGTTAAAMAALDQAGFNQALEQAVAAAVQRGNELAEGS